VCTILDKLAAPGDAAELESEVSVVDTEEMYKFVSLTHSQPPASSDAKELYGYASSPVMPSTKK
jgi:hypothetical protein